MEVTRILLLLVFISSTFCCTPAYGRARLHVKRPRYSIALPPMAEPPSPSFIRRLPALAPEPAIRGNSGLSSTNSTSGQPPRPPPPEPIDGNHGWNSTNSTAVLDVRALGAIGDGVSDDTEALKSAWEAACQGGPGLILLPQGYTFKIQSTIFAGPCRSELTFQVRHGFSVHLNSSLVPFESNNEADARLQQGRWNNYATRWSGRMASEH